MPVKNKCFSTCRLFEEPECNPPRCKYISGPTMKYCRLSHKYRMKKPDCNVTRRIKKKDLVSNARKTIGTMIKRSSKFLQTICSDSGVCISFGRNIDEITNYFKGFTNFTYANSPIKKIGEPSNNGFVNEIEFERQGYKSHAILKSSMVPESDNLVYEYLVGIKYINRILKSFPCFVQTYGLFFYNTDMSWRIMQSTGRIDKAVLTRLELQNSIDYSQACLESKYFAILIQHIKDARSITSFLQRDAYTEFITFELIYVLFIIYHALASISKEFTHYDLHSGNVLVYEPVKGKYVQYHYHHSDGTTTTFCSPYIPKIIDYGRSFFDNGNVNARKIYDKLCATPDCDRCGINDGFGWLNPKHTYYISSSKKNESHDLRLLNSVLAKIMELEYDDPNHPTEATYMALQKITKKTVYGRGIKDYDDKQYGTKQHVEKGKTKIFNVTDAYVFLKKAIELPRVITENQLRYSNVLDKLGDLHIYHDKRPMKYEPTI